MVVESSENKQWDKYPTLKIIVTCYQLLIVAVMAAVGSCFVVGIGFITSENGFSAWLIAISIVGGSVTLITLYVVIEGIKLFVNITNDLHQIKNKIVDKSD